MDTFGESLPVCDEPRRPKRVAKKPDPDLVAGFIILLDTLTNEQRTDVFREFCTDCGRKTRRCHCTNDE